MTEHIKELNRRVKHARGQKQTGFTFGQKVIVRTPAGEREGKVVGYGSRHSIQCDHVHVQFDGQKSSRGWDKKLLRTP